MANYKVTDSELTGIADVIRLKGGTSDPLVFPSGFASAINAIETQGTYISKTITSNGEYDPASDNADAFSHITVSVPSGISPVLVSKTISSNGTYNPSDDNADAYSQVVVNVSGGGGGEDIDVLVGKKSGSYFNSIISEIRDYAFYENINLTGVELTSISTINSGAFLGCSNIGIASFPNCVTIGSYAFSGCSRMTDINIPNCEGIYSYAFGNCYLLKEINIPKCSLIGSSAFWNCSSLSTAIIESCNKISGAAFMNCKKLESIYLSGSTVATLDAVNAFYSTPISVSTYTGRFGSIYVPLSLVDEYKNASRWSTYSNRITEYVV